MTELRERLEGRSERFDLPPGAMDRMFARGARRQRRRRAVTAIFGLAIGLAGAAIVISAFRGPHPTPADRPSPSPSVSSIPDGAYWTGPVTRPQILSTLRRAGFTKGQANELYFDHLTIPFTVWIQQGLVINDGFWFQTARNASGREEAGWGGKFRIIGPHQVQATDNVCTITYWFSLSNGSLSLRVLRETGPPAECEMDIVPQTAIYEPAPFIATSSATPEQG